MSIIETHTKSQTFAKSFADLLADARKRGQAPPTAEDAVAGMHAITKFYESKPATEESAKQALDLAETLFYDYGHFAPALSTAIKQQ